MGEIETRTVGRPCLTCASPQRAEIEEALTSGESLMSVSSTYGLDRNGLRRHRENHLHWSPELARQAGQTPSTILVRLVELEQNLREAGMEAGDANRRTEQARLADSQVRVLTTMAALAGPNAETIAAEIQYQRIQLGALWRLTRKHPALAERLAAELDSLDQPVIAQQVRTQFLETNRELKS